MSEMGWVFIEPPLMWGYVVTVGLRLIIEWILTLAMLNCLFLLQKVSVPRNQFCHYLSDALVKYNFWLSKRARTIDLQISFCCKCVWFCALRQDVHSKLAPRGRYCAGFDAIKMKKRWFYHRGVRLFYFHLLFRLFHVLGELGSIKAKACLKVNRDCGKYLEKYVSTLAA